MRYLAAVVLILCTFNMNAFAATPEELLERAQREGISAIASRPETLLDRDLDYLDLIAAVTEDKRGAKEVSSARALRGLSVVTDAGIEPGLPESMQGALRMVRNNRGSQYVVVFGNQSGQVANEIVVFYRTRRTLSTGLPATPIKVQNLPDGAVYPFQLGECNQLVDYVVGVFDARGLVSKIPSAGNMTPAMAANLNPGDRNPCEDHWHLAADFYPFPG